MKHNLVMNDDGTAHVEIDLDADEVKSFLLFHTEIRAETLVGSSIAATMARVRSSAIVALEKEYQKPGKPGADLPHPFSNGGRDLTDWYLARTMTLAEKQAAAQKLREDAVRLQAIQSGEDPDAAVLKFQQDEAVAKFRAEQNQNSGSL